MCLWCGRAEGDRTTIAVEAPGRIGGSGGEKSVTVHPEHANAVRAYVAEVRESGRRFLGGIALFAIAGPLGSAGVILLSRPVGLLGMGLSVVGTGATLIRYPFATPETVRFIGIRTAKRVVRAVGAGVVLLGVGIAGWAMAGLPT